MASDADIARVRSFIARELETINEYAAFAAATEDPVIRQMFVHVTEEEKEHVAEGMRLLNAMDAGQASRTAAHVEELLGGGTSPASPAAHAAPSAPAPSASPLAGASWTVGSLRKAR